MAEMIEAKVASGEYPSSSAVVIEGLHVLKDMETPLEEWLRTEVAAAYDEADSSPDSLISAKDLRSDVSEWHRKALDRA
jgi:Arc/MetJ-type ribon-helix-helix transcriptional regulator